MPLTALVVVLGNLIFILACGTVGVRLLLKAKRTRQAPELYMGLSLLLMVGGVPMLAASGIGRTTVGELRLPLLAVGLAMLAGSIAFQSAFVVRTFRPGLAWARLLGLSLSAFGIVVMSRIVFAAATSPADMMSVDAVRATVLWIRVPFAASYAWTAVEGFRQFRMAQRREKLDLGDPILTNRFFLWTCVGGLACANSALATVLHVYRVTPFNHPLGATCMGVGASLASIALLLAFMPPGRYIGWLRARHGLTST